MSAQDMMVLLRSHHSHGKWEVHYASLTRAELVYIVRRLTLKYVVILTGSMETKCSHKYNYLCINVWMIC